MKAITKQLSLICLFLLYFIHGMESQNRLLNQTKENEMIDSQQNIQNFSIEIKDKGHRVNMEIIERTDGITIKRIILPKNISQSIEEMRKKVTAQVEEKIELIKPMHEELNKELEAEKEIHAIVDSTHKQFEEFNNQMIQRKGEIKKNADQCDMLLNEILTLDKDRPVGNEILKKAKTQNPEDEISINDQQLKNEDNILQKISCKLEEIGQIKSLIQKQQKQFDQIKSLVLTILDQMNRAVALKHAKAEIVQSKFAETNQLLQSMRECILHKPSTCVFAERFSMEFWSQFLIDNGSLLLTHSWGEHSQFPETTENKKWLKESLSQIYPKNVLKYISFGSMDYGKKFDATKGESIMIPALDEKGVPLLLQVLKEKITDVLNSWGNKGFIIKPTRGCMSEGNIFVKKTKTGYTTKTVDRARKYEKFYKDFTNTDDLIFGIYELIINRETWKDFHFLDQISSYTYSGIVHHMTTEILIEDLMDMPDHWFFPFELRVTLLYGKPLVIWIITNHSEYLIVWRADKPKEILHWKATHFLNKCEFSTEDFYDETLIFHIIKVTTKLAEYYNFVYGRIDLFTTKSKWNFDWYINEVQYHGLEPEILYPKIINIEADREVDIFRSLFPLRYDGNKQNALNLKALPSLLSILHELINLFPEMNIRDKLLSLYEDQSPMLTKIIQEMLNYKMKESESQLKEIQNLLENLLK